MLIPAAEQPTIEAPEDDLTMRALLRAEHGAGLSLTHVRLSGAHRPLRAPRTARVYYVLDGSASFTVGDEELVAGAGDVVVVPQGERYSLAGELDLSRPQCARLRRRGRRLRRMSELADRTILVTGASKGIGAAIVRALGEGGASVIAHYGSDEAGVREATAAIPQERKLLLAADLEDPEAPTRLWAEAVDWRGGVDTLVNNAAIMAEMPLDAADVDWDRTWETTLRVNVLAAASLMRHAVRHFQERGGGVLVTLSSWAAQRGAGNSNLVAYAASKAAVKAMAQTIARNHAAEGVLSYVVAPGVVRTRMSEVAAASRGGEEAVTATLAMGEWVPPAEVAALVAFLATGRARHLTGATLDVNGASYIR